jgi:hypothetical protein
MTPDFSPHIPRIGRFVKSVGWNLQRCSLLYREKSVTKEAAPKPSGKDRKGEGNLIRL